MDIQTNDAKETEKFSGAERDKRDITKRQVCFLRITLH